VLAKKGTNRWPVGSISTHHTACLDQGLEIVDKLFLDSIIDYLKHLGHLEDECRKGSSIKTSLLQASRVKDRTRRILTDGPRIRTRRQRLAHVDKSIFSKIVHMLILRLDRRTGS
jgi:hypothetical protein